MAERLSTGRRKEGQTERIEFKGSETVPCDVRSENPQNCSDVDTAGEQLYNTQMRKRSCVWQGRFIALAIKQESYKPFKYY